MGSQVSNPSNEAKCPACGEWSPVSWQDDLPPGGYWWTYSGCCPRCGHPVLVETECEFRGPDFEAKKKEEA